MTLKPLIWLGTSLHDVRRFQALARCAAGRQLWELQQGDRPRDWRPMPDIGLGVEEIRIHIGREFRALYVAKFSEAVYVLHAFEKKDRRTPHHDIAVAPQRYRSLLRQRGSHTRPPQG